MSRIADGGYDRRVTPDDTASSRHRQLVDFGDLARRLRMVATATAAVALAGMLANGALRGFGTGLLVGWASLYVVAVLLGTAVLTGLHAVRGVNEATRRGERLSGADVGLLPPRRDAGPRRQDDTRA
jgi:hypothetical protein